MNKWDDIEFYVRCLARPVSAAVLYILGFGFLIWEINWFTAFSVFLIVWASRMDKD